MTRYWLRVTMALGSLALGFAPAWAQPQQPAPQMQRQLPQIQQQQPQLQQQLAPGQCTSPDRVAVTALSINPQQPRQGQTVTVSLTIRNVCNGPLANVPWRIEVGTGAGPNQVLGSGVQQYVPSGTSFTVTANWTATPGQRGLLGTADPDNLSRESSQNRINNYRDLALNVPQVSAQKQGSGEAQQIEVRVLDQSLAHQTGANFAQAAEGLTSCRHDFAGSMAGVPQSGAVMLDCRDSIPSGGRANYELFGNFHLKNGWTVVRAEASKITKTGEADLRWDSELPSAGSNNPFVKIHLWANSGGFILVTYKVTIQGPRGTEPY